MNIGFKGKNILITGAAKGIGRGIALAAAAEGANIGLHYRESEAAALQVAKEISDYGVKVALMMKETLDHDLVPMLTKKHD
ncbi:MULTISPECIES: SDR family NAD(P)-dependent oxidoreductase [Peribacillus]|uniref:SDR family NAD(P)-dependent oxidoreductase n=1 Tax=Peribacillus frigoritolerans TaxID=450367 RepID=UPI003DA18895